MNNIKINVLEYIGSLDKEYDKRKLVSAYNTRSRNENVINLLLLKDDDKEHLVWIKEYGKFQGMGYNNCKMYWCSQCLSEAYDSQEKLNEHLKLCMNHEAVKAILPEKNKVNFIGDREDILKFKNYSNKFEHPFSIFIDFESTLNTGSERNPRLLEILLEIPLGVLAVQPTRADWLDL